ncbi:MAG: hypothetical protein JRI68_12095 [Deltaproteobacteria bacterium]|nr:hypothetical protein [Deltaproteobacteria bacterium]
MKLRYAIVAGALLTTGCVTEEVKEDSGPNYVGVDGVWIWKVSMYQSVEHVLGGPGVVGPPSTVPLVAGRDAIVRVFYDADPAKIGSVVRGRLEISGYGEVTVDGTLSDLSYDHDMGTTLNFGVPGEAVKEPFEYRASIEHEGDEDDDNPLAHHPAQGRESHFVEGPQNTLRVILAPFAYHADGSGRLPDTSPESVEKYRQGLLAMYPVSNVEVSVRAPHDHHNAIGSDGSGWNDVGVALYQFRSQDGTPDDVYYYGIFNPNDTFDQYCQGGCQLGVTLMNDIPPDVGTVALRMAMGVGYPEVTYETVAHELGHSHGRLHAPCGPGLDPNSIDPAFPYDDGGIGAWGLDSVSLEIKDPTVAPGWFTTTAGPSDMMSYCVNEWVSDYTYTALFHRGKNVNLPDMHGAALDAYRAAPLAQVDHELIAVDGQGHATWQPRVKKQLLGPADSIPVNLRTADGRSLPTRGHYYRYDHLPGGWLFFPTPSEPVQRVEVTLEGRRVSVQR